MGTRRLRFESEEQYRALRSSLVPEKRAYTREHGAFLFATPTDNGSLDVVDYVVLDPDEFAVQTPYYLELHDDALQRMIVRAHTTSTALVEAHSHPFARGRWVRFSQFDCQGLSDVGPQVSWRLPGRPYIALVFGRHAFDSLYWEGRDQRPQGVVDILVGEKLLCPTGESGRFWRQNDG